MMCNAPVHATAPVRDASPGVSGGVLPLDVDGVGLQGGESRAAGGSGAARVEDAWLRLWSVRLGTVDERLLRRTRGAVLGMEGSAPASAGLATLSDARMKKVLHKESFARAASPLDVVHMDVVSVSLMDLLLVLMDLARVRPECQRD